MKKSSKRISGIITWVDLEGGFFGILAEDGKKYDPVSGLPSSARKEGKRITADISPSRNLTVRMWGEPVVLSDVVVIE